MLSAREHRSLEISGLVSTKLKKANGFERVGVGVAGLVLTVVGISLTVSHITNLQETTVELFPRSPPPYPLHPPPPAPVAGAIGLLGPGSGCTWPCFSSHAEAAAHSPSAQVHTHQYAWTHNFTCFMPTGMSGAMHHDQNNPQACPDEALHLPSAPPSPPPPSLSPPTPAAPPSASPPPASQPSPTSVSCMPTTVSLTNTGANYLIDGSSADRFVGTGTYVFLNVPAAHPVRLQAHGSAGYGCAPTIVSYTNDYGNAYHGTVTYSFGPCSAPQASEMRCGVHGVMNLGVPRLTVHASC